jgi:propionyl-CoA carboxylase alpha chain
MFDSVLIANRGEIACRIIRSARALGMRTIAVYSEADKNALHVDMASDAILLGPAPAAQSYLNVDALIRAVEESGADCVHPGYGFLSENAQFAERLAAAGVAFVGPTIEAVHKMGDKIASKKIAMAAGVPTVPGGGGAVEDAAEARRIAREIGYPVMLKASAGGGGKGMRVVAEESQIEDSLRACRNEAKGAFGDDRVFVEKFIVRPRHIEIQVLADQHGTVLHLGERECSIQRRHQKVIEECPSPFVTPQMRERMGAAAVALAREVGYTSAGTVEFVVDAERNFYFLEMNTRLQVEHPVTEMVTGVDIVEQMFRVAAGEKLSFSQSDVTWKGSAIEARLYAEDPTRGFLPAIGRLVKYREPTSGVFGTQKSVRIDAGVTEGDEITRFYDPMISKLIANGPTRDEAIRSMCRALDEFEVRGLATNIEFLAAIMAHPRFHAAELDTGFIAKEFGDRFIPMQGNYPDVGRLVAVAAVMSRILAARRTNLQPRLRDGTPSPAPSHPRVEDDGWVVVLNNAHYAVQIAVAEDGYEVRTATHTYLVRTDWSPSKSLFQARIDGEDIIVQCERAGDTITFRHSGFRAIARVMTPRAADMLSRMPEKTNARTQKILVSPMPGLVKSIVVAAGAEVRIGDPLISVEAMKMENQLTAEADGTVKAILVAPGQSVEVNQTLIEFA